MMGGSRVALILISILIIRSYLNTRHSTFTCLNTQQSSISLIRLRVFPSAGWHPPWREARSVSSLVWMEAWLFLLNHENILFLNCDLIFHDAKQKSFVSGIFEDWLLSEMVYKQQKLSPSWLMKITSGTLVSKSHQNEHNHLPWWHGTKQNILRFGGFKTKTTTLLLSLVH